MSTVPDEGRSEGPPPYPGPPRYPGPGDAGQGYPPPGQAYPPPGQGQGYPPPGQGQGYPPPGYGSYDYGSYGYGYGGDYPAAPPYASYLARVGGFLIDAVLLAVVDGIIGSILTANRIGALHFHTSTGTTYVSVVSYLAELLIWLAYGGLFIGSRRGQTPGMMAVGVRAVDRDTGTPIGFARAVGRAAFEYLMVVLIFVGWILDVLWPAWDARRQTLHDKVTRTVVVKASMVPPAR